MMEEGGRAAERRAINTSADGSSSSIIPSSTAFS
jgi:hypothetical protein